MPDPTLTTTLFARALAALPVVLAWVPFAWRIER